MKISSFIKGLAIPVIVTIISCNKQADQIAQNNKKTTRQIQFKLSTDQDFSGDNHTILFHIFIQNAGSLNLWDSSLSPMMIKDIPGVTNKLTITKSIIVDDSSMLKVGFRYSIQNVGEAGYIDTSNAGARFKVVDFIFR